MEIPFETNYLYRMNNYGNVVLLENQDYGENLFYTKGYVKDGLMGICKADEAVGHYKITAYKKYDRQSQALAALLNGAEPKKWDWEESTETIMTVAEIEEKLGVHNLKIVKEK